MIIQNSKFRGFTLVELLVVVAIIAILTGIVTSNFTKSRSQARDAKRLSDVGHLQLALELYFDRCNRYPDSDGATIWGDSSCNTNTGEVTFVPDFISTIPTPPDGAGDGFYNYATDAYGTNYALRAVLENSNEAINDALSGTVLGIECNQSANHYCVGPK